MSAERDQQALRALFSPPRPRTGETRTVPGGAAADAYSLLRRAAQRIDQATSDRDCPREARAELREALTAVHKAEEHLGAAIRNGAI